jgi:mannose-6-phosphate isomerase-like protein (cupin superfamily)
MTVPDPRATQRLSRPAPPSEHNDEVFYVLEGTASILIGEAWVDVGKGSFIRIPAGVTHDFENRTHARMGLLNVFIPGGFEQKMPAIVDWFEQNR